MFLKFFFFLKKKTSIIFLKKNYWPKNKQSAQYKALEEISGINSQKKNNRCNIWPNHLDKN